jgi:molybdopterin-guanine dinucleotide biosynthesis protein A
MRSAVILAGGAGSRLGEEKSLTDFEGRPLLEWSIEKLARIVDDMVIVARNREHSGLLEDLFPDMAIAFDQIAGYGPVAGLAAGMDKAKGEYALAVGCDLPFLNLDVINRLFELAHGYDAAVPINDSGMMEPLHAVYQRESMLAACRRSIEKGERRIRSPLAMLRVKCISMELFRPLDPDLLTFFNLNTKEDLEIARRLWRKPKCGVSELDISDIL